MQYTVEIITYIAAPTLTAFVSWFISRKRYRVDNKTVEIENNEKLLIHYGKEIDSLTKRIESYREENHQREERIKAYRQENQERERLYLEREAEQMRALRESNSKVDHLLLWFCCRERCKDRVTEDCI